MTLQLLCCVSDAQSEQGGRTLVVKRSSYSKDSQYLMACEKINVYMNIILLSKLGDALETERQQSTQSDRTNWKYMTEQTIQTAVLEQEPQTSNSSGHD